jgi:hypothetical protein
MDFFKGGNVLNIFEYKNESDQLLIINYVDNHDMGSVNNRYCGEVMRFCECSHDFNRLMSTPFDIGYFSAYLHVNSINNIMGGLNYG